MAQGIYKNGVAIEVTYQAVNCATGKIVQMKVYDEAHALDATKSSAMTEIGATGRYYASFTPDAEGIWTLRMYNETDSNGEVVKQYAVAGHDVDSIGDAVGALNDVSTTEVNTEVDNALDTAIPVTPTADSVNERIKAIDEKLPTGDISDITTAEVNIEVDNALDTAIPITPTANSINERIKTMDGFIDQSLTGMESGIRGEDSDTLKTLSDQLDSVSAPAMVG